jgi:broad-specificity NMP kinase
VIVWINGTFGVGKTTTAELVCDQTGWRLFDPEQVGYLVGGAARRWGHDYDDFQDLAPWRTLVPTVAAELHRFAGRPLVAVQTVLVEQYWAELADGLAGHDLPVRHVVLDCQVDELRRRIDTDEVESQARQWRLDHIETFEQARPWLARSADTVIDTTTRSPQQVAAEVIAAT